LLWNHLLISLNISLVLNLNSVSSRFAIIKRVSSANKIGLDLSDTLSYSTEQSPSREANQFFASQKIPCILWNPKVHYHIHKCLPPITILSQLNVAHTPTSTPWRSILILSSHLCLGLPSDLFPSDFSTKTLYMPFLSPIQPTCPTHLILLNLIT